MTRIIAVAVLVVCLWYADPIRGCRPGEAWAEEANRVVRIASQDQSLLIETGAGSLRVVHVGDKVAPFGTIQSIDPARIVFKNADAETLIVTLINGKQKIQRIGRAGPSPHLPVAQTITAGHGGAEAGKAAGGVLKPGVEEKK